VRQFGDVTVTVLLDMGYQIGGTETVTAQGIQNLIDMPGDGTCAVSVQRLGIDTAPQRMTTIGAGHLRAATAPMQWVNWWKKVPSGDHHVVVLVVYELCAKVGYIEQPKSVKLLPLGLAVGVPPDLLSRYSSIPEQHVLHVSYEKLAAAWGAVYRSIERVRAIPDSADPRLIRKSSFQNEDQEEVLSRLVPDSAYPRHIGFPYHTLLAKQRQSMLHHAR
jgi:hypothetical protein